MVQFASVNLATTLGPLSPQVCGDTGGATRLVLCENVDAGCLGGVHLYCCVPLRSEPPSEAWYCSECQVARKEAAAARLPAYREREAARQQRRVERQQQKAQHKRNLLQHTRLHEQLIRFFAGFKTDAHPMAIMVGVVGALRHTTRRTYKAPTGARASPPPHAAPALASRACAARSTTTRWTFRIPCTGT